MYDIRLYSELLKCEIFLVYVMPFELSGLSSERNAVHVFNPSLVSNSLCYRLLFRLLRKPATGPCHAYAYLGIDAFFVLLHVSSPGGTAQFWREAKRINLLCIYQLYLLERTMR